MKKRTIGVMVLGLTGDFVPKFLNGILKFANNKDFNIVVCQVKFPEWPYGHFDYQYIASLEFLKSNSIDAIIVLTSFFISTTPIEKLVEYMESISHKPIVSVGAELPYKNSYSLTSDCEDCFRETFSHLINVHGCKRIGFLAANSTTSSEAVERFEAYKKMLSENNMEFDPEIVFEGAFSLWQARDSITEAVKNQGLTFDALIAANDQMAFGAITALTQLNIRVPDDVKVVGYDDSEQCNKLSPSVSTVNQNIEMQGYEAARIAFDHLSGIKNDKKALFYLKNVYRQSCGCVSMKDEVTDHVTPTNEKVTKTDVLQNETVNQYADTVLTMLQIYELLDLIQANTTIRDFFSTFEKTMQFIAIKKFAVCLYEEPVILPKGDFLRLSDNAELIIAIDKINQKQIVNPEIFFDPNENIIPENIFDDDFGNYILEPIFLGEKHYGYALYDLDLSKLTLSTIFFRAISNGIGNACEYTAKQYENEHLAEVSKTDELTKLLNRRGFMSTASTALKYANNMQSKGLVFFCDMDGLKKINDSFGHDFGDLAIRGIAEALRRTFRKNDVIGRLSGDEFAVVAIGSSMKQFDMLYKKALKNCETIVQENKFPFTLSLSAGAVEFGENDTDLQKLLGLADKIQYIEKRRKHAERAD